MANDNGDSAAIAAAAVSGQSESGTGTTSPPPNTANSKAPRRSPSAQKLPAQEGGKAATVASTPPTSTLPKRTPTSNAPVASPSTGNTPKTSRNSSPQRKEQRPYSLATPSQPSAAAIQRALSATSIPTLQPGAVSEAVSKLPQRGIRSTGTSAESTPQYPLSPRLTSPPPARKGLSTTQQKQTSDTNVVPSINLQKPTPPQLSTPPPKPSQSKDTAQSTPPRSPAQTSKPPARGPSGRSTLETVQESSADAIPESPAAVQARADLKPLTKLFEEDKAPVKTDGAADDHARGESGSESGGNKSDKQRGRRQSLPKNGAASSASTNVQQSKPSYTSLSTAKSRKNEGTRNMTVETETVQSIPQSALNAGDRSGNRGESGSIKLKPSSETIRPKKERKKTGQKPRSINQGTGMQYTPRSPFLYQRVSCDDLRSTGSTTGSSETDEPSTGLVDQKRSVSLSQQAQRAFRNWRLSRSQSNQYLREASSKADIFEARVANAVDEANTSDSDETFVYESNPPEPQRRPRHHSRTPSVTSSHSVADPQRSAMRGFGDALDDRRVGGKRSMKFSSNPLHDPDSPADANGTVRSHQPRHIGRYGQRGGSQANMHDPDSPFTQASKLRTSALGGRHSRPNSPRSPQNMQQQPRSGGLFAKKNENSFDLGGEAADDERTPLMGTVRTPRSARHRRLRSGGEDEIHPYYGVRRQGRCGGRWGGCLLGIAVIVMAVASAIGFLVMSNRPMYDVRIKKIQNVLASEQELILDVMVAAVNPNALGITVSNMDVRLFAKSKHVSDDEQVDGAALLSTSASQPLRSVRTRRQQRSSHTSATNPNPSQDLSGHWHTPTGGVDEGTDPDPDKDLERDAQTMLLGRVLHFDQPLAFDGSPIKRHSHFSLGEIRLSKPGNKTEIDGGSARWKEILQDPFELIVRGVLKYQLPISSRTIAAAVGASMIVHPEDGVDEQGNMRLEEINHEEHWQWIDWDDIEDYPDSRSLAKDGTLSSSTTQSQ